MDNFTEVWNKVKSKLGLKTEIMESWISRLTPIRLVGNEVFLHIKTEFARGIIMNNYGDLIQKTFEDVLGFQVTLIILAEEVPENTPIRTSRYIPELQDDKDMLEKLNQAERQSVYRHTFDTFIVGESNRLAHAACRHAAGDSGSSMQNPIYIYGEPGLGKTHLLNATRTDYVKNFPGRHIIYTTSENFVTDYVYAVNNGTIDDFRRKLRGCDMLLIDDVQFFSGKKESLGELFSTFNELHQNGKQIVFTSDRPPREINDIEERMRSRFEWGLMADIALPEYETRLAIIRRKSELIGIDIPDNVMEFMADKLKNNIRQLEGAIVKLNAMKQINGSIPTVVTAQRIIREVLSDVITTEITVDKILGEVAAMYSVQPDDLKGQNRTSQISTARQIAIYCTHALTDLSYTLIGQEFGGRDHSTVVYAIKKVIQAMKDDSSVRSGVERIMHNLTN